MPIRFAILAGLSLAAFCLTPVAPTDADDGRMTRATQSPLQGDGAQLLERMQSALVDLIDRVGPSVVAIQAQRNPKGLGRRDDWTPRPWVSTGSGVIIRNDGRILTSQHVIDGAVSIHVVLHDGRRVSARRIAADRRSDLAIIRINAGNLRAAELGDASNVRRGHIVLALGNPLGLSSDGQAAVSHGLISAIGRPLPETFGREEDRYYGDMIQTTAPISPGNSGGPLIDIHGRVIGVVTAVSTRSDGREGIGFAVPINAHARSIIDKLLRGQQVAYGYLGVEVAPLSERRRRVARLSAGRGVLIASVEPGGPAEQAGLRGGDVVVSVDGQTVQTVEQFVRTIGAAGPGHEVKLAFVRKAGQKKTAAISLARRQNNTAQPLPDVAFSFRGAELGEVDSVMRSMSNLPENALLVLRIDANSPAEHAGLTPGDIISRVDGKPLQKQPGPFLAHLSGSVLLGLANGGSVLVKAE